MPSDSFAPGVLTLYSHPRACQQLSPEKMIISRALGRVRPFPHRGHRQSCFPAWRFPRLSCLAAQQRLSQLMTITHVLTVQHEFVICKSSPPPGLGSRIAQSQSHPAIVIHPGLRSVGARPRPRPGAMSGGLICALWRSPSPSKCPIQRFRTPTNVGYHHHHGARSERVGGKRWATAPTAVQALAPYFSAGALLGLLGCESPYRAVRGS